MEEAAKQASRQAIAESKALGLPVFSYDRARKANVLEQPDGQRFAIEFKRDGTYTILEPLTVQAP